eukprot:127766_1
MGNLKSQDDKSSHIIWQYKNEDNIWVTMDSSAIKSIQKAYNSNKKQFCYISCYGFKYKIDFKTMIQINTTNGKSSEIRRLIGGKIIELLKNNVIQNTLTEAIFTAVETQQITEIISECAGDNMSEIAMAESNQLEEKYFDQPPTEIDQFFDLLHNINNINDDKLTQLLAGFSSGVFEKV